MADHCIKRNIVYDMIMLENLYEELIYGKCQNWENYNNLDRRLDGSNYSWKRSIEIQTNSKKILSCVLYIKYYIILFISYCQMCLRGQANFCGSVHMKTCPF